VIEPCGQFVVFLYKGYIYAGKIISFKVEKLLHFRYGEGLNSLKWPEKLDILEYKLSCLLEGIHPPKLMSKQGFYSIPNLLTFFEFGLSVSGL
jgi:hypothetical protein